MTRSEFARAIAEDSKLDIETILAVLNSGEYVLMETLRAGEEVRPFMGVRFSPCMQKGCLRLNPRTLDKVMTTDRMKCKVIFSKVFKDKLNEVDEDA